MLRLKHTGLDDEFYKLASSMKTKRRTMKKSITKKLGKKRSVGRPRKSKVKSEPFSDMSSESISMHTTATRGMPLEQIEMCQIIKPFNCSPVISDVQVCIHVSNIIIILMFLNFKCFRFSFRNILIL